MKSTTAQTTDSFEPIPLSSLPNAESQFSSEGFKRMHSTKKKAQKPSKETPK